MSLMGAVVKGATMVTHLFNAMGAFHHRRPGPVAAALTNPELTVSIIADGHHVHPAGFQLAYLCKGAAGLVLISDAVAAAGMSPGTSALAGCLLSPTAIPFKPAMASSRDPY